MIKNDSCTLGNDENWRNDFDAVTAVSIVHFSALDRLANDEAFPGGDVKFV